MKPPVLLCYQLQAEKARLIHLLAMRLMIRVRTVLPEEFGQTLAALCGYEPLAETTAAGQAFSDEMLVLGNFPQELITRFLMGFRQSKIAPVALKAVLTETNMRWNSYTLRSQLAAERDAIAAGTSADHPVST
ncbi:MAG: DUF3783 domain-containing protein [Clostridiales bacterium]|nr:DUF3783 domain-containing protein [Clostridiales bacterium]